MSQLRIPWPGVEARPTEARQAEGVVATAGLPGKQGPAREAAREQEQQAPVDPAREGLLEQEAPLEPEQAAAPEQAAPRAPIRAQPRTAGSPGLARSASCTA